MNPLILFGLKVSFKNEIRVLLITFAVLLLLPVVGVVVLANSGLAAVASALVSVNPVTHKVEVKDATGLITANLELSTVWPTRGVITQEFGHPNPPYEAHHSGIDIAGRLGEPVTSFMAGKVTEVGSVTIGCGKCVYVDHGNSIVSSYSHLSEIKVAKGQEVKPGDVIGLQGQEGWATGVHLHFSVKVYGILVNPRTFMVGEPEKLQ
jgi:murein DD-endopeptidase MepM/ murein hydrolase activator NlpD